MNTFSIRPYQPDDLQGLWVVFWQARTAIGDDRPLSLDDMRLFFQMPGFDPEQDAFVVEQAGQIVAYADIQFMQDSGSCWSRGIVHPKHWHQGIGTAIIRYTEDHFLKRTCDLPLDQPLVIQRQTFDSNPAAVRLLERENYRLIHSFYDMRIDLGQPIEVPTFPPNLVLRSFNAEQQAHHLYEASQEVFADHWGFEFMTYEVWQERVLAPANGDFSLWLLALDGTEIAGFSISHVIGEGDHAKGDISSLGVRASWRKQGLGLALLQASFAQLQARDCQTVILGVDATNATNAVALYQRAGMRVDKQTLYYRKLLRGTLPNPEN